MRSLLQNISVIFIIYSIVGFGCYLFIYKFYGWYEVSLSGEKLACNEIFIRGDVLQPDLSDVFKAKMEGNNDCNSKFPISSKVFSLILPRNVTFLLTGIQLEGNGSIKINPNEMVWYCLECKNIKTDAGILVKTEDNSGELETRNINRYLTHENAIFYYFLRYFPYTVVFGFLFLLLMYTVVNHKRNILMIFDVLYWIFVIKYFDELRKYLPLAGSNKAGIVSASDYQGVSAIGDYLLIGSLIVFPFLNLLFEKIFFPKLYTKAI